MRHLSQSQVATLAASLSPRRQLLLRTVAHVRLASGGQLRRLHYASEGQSAARLARLDLAVLFEHNVLHRLERRIGGVRAGSSGYVYALGAVGRRLLDLYAGEGVDGGRSRYEPSLGFVQHALAVTEVWVGLEEYLRLPLGHESGIAIDFHVEPQAWRTYLGRDGRTTTLKPDAELCIERPGFDDLWWIEVDRATERRTVLQRKLDAYLDYFETGREQTRTGVFPLVAWLTTTAARATVLQELIDSLPPIGRQLFRVGLLTSAPPLLMSQNREEAL